MFKRRLAVLIAVAVILGIGGLSFAAMDEPGMGTKSGAVDVGNKVCPVTGEKIDETTKATYEYRGKVYNFCCPGCIDEFKKNPGKYIKKIEEEKKKEGGMSEHSEHQHMH